MYRLWDSIVKPLIYELKPTHIVEVGSENGFNTKLLLDYCISNNAKVSAIDPFPLFDVDEFKNIYGDKFEMYENLSHDVLASIENYDLILLDGDHNWYTVYNELKIIENNFDSDSFPFVIFHDISWPYGRRDLYYNPDNIPEEFRQPYEKKGMFPGENKLLEKDGFNNMLYNAIEENTPQNGVLTGIEDFIDESELDLTFKAINAFHGLGLLYLKNEKIDDIITNILNNCDLLASLEEYYLKNIITTKMDVNEIVETKDKLINDIFNISDEKEEVINDLNSQINLRDQEIAKLNSLLNHEKHILNQKENKINKLNSKIENEKRKNSLKNKKIKKMNSEINNLKKYNSKLKIQNDEILSSKSWKITKPLRKLNNSKN